MAYRLVNLLLTGPLAMFAWVGVYFWVESRFPNFELVPSNGQILADRVRRMIIRGTLAFAGLGTAAVLTALAAKIFS